MSQNDPLSVLQLYGLDEVLTAQGDPQNPHFILAVSRPSAGMDMARVHVGAHPAPLVGAGETRVWARQPDGSWKETDQVVSRWMS